MFLIVGLGNPGSKYENNRHNIGFMAADEIVRRFSLSSWTEKFQGQISKGSIGSHKVVVLKPQTYMNLSGKSVQQVANFFKIPAENLIVIHDELDLPPLKTRIKSGGGNGGHNGLKSIQQCMGTPHFMRVRLGVGHPGDKSKVSSYVLNDFSKSEMPDFEILCAHLADKMPQILNGEDQKVVSDLHNVFAPAK